MYQETRMSKTCQYTHALVRKIILQTSRERARIELGPALKKGQPTQLGTLSFPPYF